MRSMRKVLVVLIVAFGMFCIVASGGDDGGGGEPSVTPTDPETTFNLFDPARFEPGYQMAVNLTGSDSNGGQYTCSYSLKTSPLTTLSGYGEVLPIMTHLYLNNSSNGATANMITTKYYAYRNNEYIFVFYEDDTGKTSEAIENGDMPPIGKIGDFGTLGSISFSDGTSMSGSWRVLDAGNGLAKIEGTSTGRNVWGNTEFTETDTYTIDETGDPKKLDIQLYYNDHGVTINLSGNIN